MSTKHGQSVSSFHDLHNFCSSLCSIFHQCISQEGKEEDSIISYVEKIIYLKINIIYLKVQIKPKIKETKNLFRKNWNWITSNKL